MTIFNNRAALLDSNNQVIGEVLFAPKKGQSIEVAGSFTEKGDAVNVHEYKISRSKLNIEKAKRAQPVSHVVGDYYAFDV